MKHYVGIDVAPEECAVFIVDNVGAILFEDSYATALDEIAQTIVAVVRDIERIVHQAVSLPIWLTCELTK